MVRLNCANMSLRDLGMESRNGRPKWHSRIRTRVRKETLAAAPRVAMQILREEAANFAKLKRPSGDLPAVSPTRIANSRSRENGGRNSLDPSSMAAGYFERFRLRSMCRNKISRGANIIRQSLTPVSGKDICNHVIRKRLYKEIKYYSKYSLS